MHLGKITTAIVPIYLNEYVMVLNGMTGPDEYGKLVAWEDHPDAFDWMASRKQFLPGEGLLILEAQERLLSFLVHCCKQVLHEIPEETLTGDAFPIKPQPQFRTEAEVNGYDSLAVMAAEAPYRVPARLDLERIQSLLAARTSAAEDHLWALREDPGYFAATQQDIEEHRQEMIKDTQGRAHPVFDKARRGVFRARVIGNVLAEAYLPLESFSELHRQARQLRVLQVRHAAAISPLQDLPRGYLHALLRFRYYLTQAAKGPIAQLRQCATASPPLRTLFVRQPPVGVTSSKLVITSRPGVKKDRVQTELIWLLTTLWEDGQALFFARLPMVVDELERLLDSDPEANQLISPYIAGVIGDLSIISQCLRQLEIYQPWANGFEYAMVDYKEDIQKDFASQTRPWAGILSAIAEKNLMQAVDLGDISGGRFAYPMEKRRTKENVELLQCAEANLDTFWARIDQLIYARAGNLDGTAVRRLLAQPRILQRTPDWVEPLKGPSKTTATRDLDTLNKPLSTLYSGLSPGGDPGSSTKLENRTPKAKTKTRGPIKPPSPATRSSPPEESNPTDLQPTLAVDARALKVFRTLFFDHSPTAMPGEVSWTDFLHALTSTGFAAEKLYGSVWQFRPTALDVERSIQFHQPHPRGKIPFRIARRHGRRLNRAYGWFGGMFVLKRG